MKTPPPGAARLEHEDFRPAKVWERHEFPILAALTVIALVGVLIAKLDVNEMTKVTIGASAGTALLLSGGMYIYNIYRTQRQGPNLFASPTHWFQKHYEFIILLVITTALAGILTSVIQMDEMTRLIVGCSVATVPIGLGIAYDRFQNGPRHKNCFREENVCLIEGARWLKIIYLNRMNESKQSEDLGELIERVIAHEKERLREGQIVDTYTIKPQPDGSIVLKIEVESRAYRAAQEARASIGRHGPGKDRYGASLD